MKTLFLGFTLFLTSILTLNAQSNWIYNNFRTYLSNNSTKDFIEKSENIINNSTGYERERAFYTLELFKIMSEYNHNRLPICQFNIATKSIGLSFNSELLKDNIYLYSCSINGEYYYFLYNLAKNSGAQVDLESSISLPQGGFSSSTVNSGVPSYSIAFFSKSNRKYNYKVTLFRKTTSFETSPCF